MGEITLTHIGIVDRIVNKTIERIGVHMPQYYNETYFNEVNVKTRPSNFIRRILRGWQYYVGQRVYFHIEVKKARKDVDLSGYTIVEKLPGMDKPRIVVALTDTSKFSKHITNVGIIGVEGNVEYKICGRSGYFPEGGYIFTSNVINRDRFFHQWFWIFIGALITLSCTVLAWLLNLIPQK